MAKLKRQQKVEIITELELITIETERLQLAELGQRVRDARARLEQHEDSVVAKLKAGVPVEGSRTAVIEIGDGPCRPKWQELHIEHMAEEHGISEAATIEAARHRYPAKKSEVLVIGVAPEQQK